MVVVVVVDVGCYWWVLGLETISSSVLFGEETLGDTSAVDDGDGARPAVKFVQFHPVPAGQKFPFDSSVLVVVLVVFVDVVVFVCPVNSVRVVFVKVLLVLLVFV